MISILHGTTTFVLHCRNEVVKVKNCTSIDKFFYDFDRSCKAIRPKCLSSLTFGWVLFFEIVYFATWGNSNVVSTGWCEYCIFLYTVACPFYETWNSCTGFFPSNEARYDSVEFQFKSVSVITEVFFFYLAIFLRLL